MIEYMKISTHRNYTYSLGKDLSETRLDIVLERTAINIIAILLILGCNTLYSIQSGVNALLTLILMISMSVFIICRWISLPIQRDAWSRYSIWVIFVILVYTTIHIYHHILFDFSAVVQCICFLLFPLFFYIISKDNLIRYYYETFNRYILLLSVSATILWFLGPTLNLISPNCSIYDAWVVSRAREVEGWYYLLFNAADSVYILPSIQISRNSSIFVEPAIFSYLIAIALIFEVYFIKRRHSKLFIGMLLLTTMTTTSATGISIAIMIILSKLIVSMGKNGRIELKWSILLIPIAIIAIRGALNMRFAAGSGGIRFDNLHAEMVAWSHNILLGNGFGNRELVIANLSDWRMHDLGASDSIGLVFVYGGILYLSVFCVAFSGFFKECCDLDGNRNKSDSICAGLLHFIVWSLTVVLFKPVSVMFWSIGLYNILKAADTKASDFIKV